MSFENQPTKSSAPTEWQPPSTIGESTVTTPSITPQGDNGSGTPNDTGRTDLAQGVGNPDDPQTHVQNLLGPSQVAWGQQSLDVYPTEIDIGNLDSSVLDFSVPDRSPRRSSAVDGTTSGTTPAGDRQLPVAATASETEGAGAPTDQVTPAAEKKDVVGSMVANMFQRAATTISDAGAATTDAVASGMENVLGLGRSGVDQESQRIISNAQKGVKIADTQEAQYLRQWRTNDYSQNLAPPAPGDDPNNYTHKNADGSSYTVTNSRISSFTTAPTAENPQGMTYGNITYDQNGAVKSYVSPFHQKIERVGNPDRNGFATWRATSEDGKTLVKFPGADSTHWLGKPMINENGINHLIGNGKYGGYMFSRNMDGTTSTVRPEYANGRMTGLETTATLQDRTEVSRHGRFQNGKLVTDNSHIKVKEGDGPKRSEVKLDVSGQNGELVEKPKPARSAEGGDKMLAMFTEVLTPEGMKRFENVQSLSAQRTGPSSFHITGDLRNPVFMPPPNISVGGFGPLGRVSATPTGTTVDNFSLNLNIGRDHISATQMHGFNGEAQLTRHKRRHSVDIGTTSTSTNSMDWNTRNNTMTIDSGRSVVTIGAAAFDANSPTAKVLGDPTAKQSTLGYITQFNSQLDGFRFDRNRQGGLDGYINPIQDRFELPQVLNGVKSNLYVNDRINMNLAQNGGITFREGDAQLGIQIGNMRETRNFVSRISQAQGADGQPVMRVEFYGKKPPLELPIKPRTQR